MKRLLFFIIILLLTVGSGSAKIGVGLDLGVTLGPNSSGTPGPASGDVLLWWGPGDTLLWWEGGDRALWWVEEEMEPSTFVFSDEGGLEFNNEGGLVFDDY